MTDVRSDSQRARKRLDLEALAVESFEVPGYGKCGCCGEPAALDADGYCDLCGPVEEVFDYATPDCPDV